MKYSEAIRLAISDSMASNEKMIILGQGVWSPFYVGQTMDNLEKIYGRERVIDTPVSENAATGIALGSALAGSPALVIHPRMDFMILAMDPIVNAAAKWRYALDWDGPIPLTVRSIINRGGEQGAQHSQSLQSWFAHIPGLRVVMPSNPRDAYFLLRSCIESPDPCIFIEDRWSYGIEQDFDMNEVVPDLATLRPSILRSGNDITIVSFGHAVNQCLEAAEQLASEGISAEVIDVRILNPIKLDVVNESVSKTGRLVAVDASWQPCSFGSEIIASVSESSFASMKYPPIRINLPQTTAPTSPALEESFYFTSEIIFEKIRNTLV
jgi:pyruvate/2-oxoglutarate/acetoin dehydrogenase E1 component